MLLSGSLALSHGGVCQSCSQLYLLFPLVGLLLGNDAICSVRDLSAGHDADRFSAMQFPFKRDPGITVSHHRQSYLCVRGSAFGVGCTERIAVIRSTGNGGWAIGAVTVSDSVQPAAS